MMDVQIKYLNPIAMQTGVKYATPNSAAIDLIAATAKPIEIFPGQTVMIPTGVAVHPPQDENICSLLLPRSGLGAKTGLVLGNLIGLIDNDYQGEIQVAAWNRNSPVICHSSGAVEPNRTSVVINPGDRIAQLMFVRFVTVNLKRVDEFSGSTVRGTGGFGSTGQ